MQNGLRVTKIVIFCASIPVLVPAKVLLAGVSPSRCNIRGKRLGPVTHNDCSRLQDDYSRKESLGRNKPNPVHRKLKVLHTVHVRNCASLRSQILPRSTHAMALQTKIFNDILYVPSPTDRPKLLAKMFYRSGLVTLDHHIGDFLVVIICCSNHYLNALRRIGKRSLPYPRVRTTAHPLQYC